MRGAHACVPEAPLRAYGRGDGSGLGAVQLGQIDSHDGTAPPFWETMKQPHFFAGMPCMGHESIMDRVVCAMAHCPTVTAPLPAGHEGRLRRHCFSSNFAAKKKKMKAVFVQKHGQKAMESELQDLPRSCRRPDRGEPVCGFGGIGRVSFRIF